MSAAPNKSEGKASGSGALRVLIVEDAERIRRFIRDMLAGIPGVEVMAEAETLATARQALRDGVFDVMTLDIQLPDGSGIDLLREVKAEHPECVVIVLTNYPDPPYRAACAAAGAEYFLDKSKEFEKVAQIVARLRIAEHWGKRGTGNAERGRGGPSG